MIQPVQTRRIVGISILAGLAAGGIVAGINLALVHPLTSALADIELENLVAEGSFDQEEFDSQMQTVYYSQLYGPIITGLISGAGLGVIFVIGKIRKSFFRTAFAVVGVTWFVLYVIPSVKYPPSPTATFDPGMAGNYQMLLAGFTALSGLTALVITLSLRKIKRRDKVLAAGALYFAIIAGAFFVFPDYHGENDSLLPQAAVNTWRFAILLSMTAFWFLLGGICGILWMYGSEKNPSIP